MTAIRRLLFLFILLTPALASAQTTIVGTCDQYQPGPGGDYCINTGSATYWQQFTGDVVNTRNVPQCSPTNTSACGKMTVTGILGFPIIGAPVDGDTLCFQASPAGWVWCAP